MERIVADEPEMSTYFTPISITINVDSFEHLEFETRPDQLIVYTLVQGDERVVIEFVPGATARTRDRRRPRQLEFDTGRVRPDGAPRARGSRGVADRRRDRPVAGAAAPRVGPRYRPRSPRTYGMPSAAGAPIRLRIASRDPSTSATSTSA